MPSARCLSTPLGVPSQDEPLIEFLLSYLHESAGSSKWIQNSCLLVKCTKTHQPGELGWHELCICVGGLTFFLFCSCEVTSFALKKILSEDNKASVVGLIPCKSNIKAHTEMLRSVPFLLCVCKLVQCEDLHSLSLFYCVQCAGVWTHKEACFQSQRVKPVGVPLFQWKEAKRPICSNPRS